MPSSFSCDDCGSIFTRKNNLLRHIRRRHDVKTEHNVSPKSFSCDDCGSTFTRKNNLLRHIRRRHDVNTEHNVSPKSFPCDDCESIFARKDSLLQHIRKGHNMNEGHEERLVRPKLYICATCEKEYSRKSILLKHIQNKHGFQVGSRFKRTSTEYHECIQCSGKFASKYLLNKHMRIHLPGKKCLKNAPRLKCLKCNAVYPNRNILLDHLNRAHNIQPEFEDKFFASFKEFEKWVSPCYYHKTSWVTCDHIVRRYSCHRSGFYQDNSYKMGDNRRQRHLKIGGTKKLQGFCPGEVTVREKKIDGSCHVLHQKQHVGHDIHNSSELQHLYLKENEKKEIACQLKIGVAVQTILRNVYQEFNLEDGITDKDIQNINSTNGVIQPFTITNDPIYVDINSFVSQHSSSILYYKEQGHSDEQYNTFKKEDFILIFQNEFQKENLLKFGHKIVAIDKTHSSSLYNFTLHTMLVLDLQNEGVPVAFLLSNCADQSVMDIFIWNIRNSCGLIYAKTLMSDMDNTYYQRWRSIMCEPEVRLHCIWHVVRRWWENLQKLIVIKSCKAQLVNGKQELKSNELVGEEEEESRSVENEEHGAKIDDEIRDNVNTELCVGKEKKKHDKTEKQEIIDDTKAKLKAIYTELDESEFLKKLNDFLTDKNPILQPFIKYFRNEYVTGDKFKYWAFCYRHNAGIHMNMAVEAFHRVFKYKIAQRKKVKTLSAGLYCIEEYMKYQTYHQELKKVRPSICKKLRILRARHLTMEKYLEKGNHVAVETIDNERWQVASFQETSDLISEMYTVQKVNPKECLLHDENCGLLCEACQSCFHEYCCSCIDSTIKNNMCEHIHALCQFLIKNQETSNDVAVPSVPNSLTSLDDEVIFSEMPLDSPDLEMPSGQGLDKSDFNVIEPMEGPNKNIETLIDNMCNNMKEMLKFHLKPGDEPILQIIFKQFFHPIEPTLLALKKKRKLKRRR